MFPSLCSPVKSYVESVKASKAVCTAAFTKCKKAQDAAVGFVSTCSQVSKGFDILAKLFQDSSTILDNLKTLGDNEEATSQVGLRCSVAKN